MANPLDEITPLILTYNEDANIGRTLAGLTWAKRIVVVDSGSTDKTTEILQGYPQVEVAARRFDTFADQCNFGISLIRTPWCLSLDADHLVTPEFLAELSELVACATAKLAAISTPFRYLVYGRKVRGSLLPPRFNVIRPGHGLYINDGHGHQFIPNGATIRMKQPLLHDDRKPLQRWLESQERYHWQEAWKLHQTIPREMGLADKIRFHTPLAPFLVLLLCLVWKCGIKDGRAGVFYAFQRCYAEIQIWLMLQELRHNNSPQSIPKAHDSR